MNPNSHPIPSPASVVQEPHMESHSQRTEMTASRTIDAQTSGVLRVMQPYLQTRDQASQLPLAHVSREPSVTPTVDISRKLPESTGPKDRPLTAQPIHETPNLSYHAVPVDNHSSAPARTTSDRIQVEQTPEENFREISSQSQSTFPTLLNQIQSTPSTPVVIDIKSSIARSSVALPSIRQSSSRGQTAVLEDASLQIRPSFGNAIESSVSQGAHHSPVISNIVAEHKATQQVPTYPLNARSVDVSIDPKVSSSLDIPIHHPPSHVQIKPMEFPLSQQGQTTSFPPMEIACSLPPPTTSAQLSSAEYLPQNVCKARTDRTPLDDASRSQTQISHSLQEESAGSDSKARALPTSIEPSSPMRLNENIGHLQPTDINMADETSVQTLTARTLDQALRYPVMTESRTTSSGSHSMLQQRKTTDMRAEAVHSEDMSLAFGALNDANHTSHSALTSSFSNVAINQVSPPLKQVVQCHGIAGSSLEASTSAKMQASSDLSKSVIAAKDINSWSSERPGEFGNAVTSSSTRDVIHINSRHTNTQGVDIGGVVTSSVKCATVNSISLPSDQITSDGPSRYRSSTESVRNDQSLNTLRFILILLPVRRLYIACTTL